jgi:hypothetical protein
MNSSEGIPHGAGVVLYALDVDMLGSGEMGEDIAGSLFFGNKEALKGLAVLDPHLSIQSLLLSGEGDLLPILLDLLLDERQLRLSPVVIHNAPCTQLAKASLFGSAPFNVVELSEEGHRKGLIRHHKMKRQ